jgi:hypothetical protein
LVEARLRTLSSSILPLSSLLSGLPRTFLIVVDVLSAGVADIAAWLWLAVAFGNRVLVLILF